MRAPGQSIAATSLIALLACTSAQSGDAGAGDTAAGDTAGGDDARGDAPADADTPGDGAVAGDPAAGDGASGDTVGGDFEGGDVLAALCPPQPPYGTAQGSTIPALSLPDCEGVMHDVHDLCKRKAGWFFIYAGY